MRKGLERTSVMGINSESVKIAEAVCLAREIRFDKNGILVPDLELNEEAKSAREVWEGIYNFNLDEFKKDRADFFESKLNDHIHYIRQAFQFSPQTIYLEIGCGPSYIGEYLMKNFDSHFVGIDLNYEMLLTAKNYFDEIGYKKYLLIYGDLKKIPMRNESIDFVYGGGVIEHFKDTRTILMEIYRLLKTDGVSFNTVPAFNLVWLFIRGYSNIPSLPFLKQLFEFIHIKVLKNKILNRYYGYELSFTRKKLESLHYQIGFKSIVAKAFAFHPSVRSLKSKFLREVCYKIQTINLSASFFYVYGRK